MKTNGQVQKLLEPRDLLCSSVSSNTSGFLRSPRMCAAKIVFISYLHIQLESPEEVAALEEVRPASDSRTYAPRHSPAARNLLEQSFHRRCRCVHAGLGERKLVQYSFSLTSLHGELVAPSHAHFTAYHAIRNLKLVRQGWGGGGGGPRGLAAREGTHGQKERLKSRPRRMNCCRLFVAHNKNLYRLYRLVSYSVLASVLGHQILDIVRTRNDFGDISLSSNPLCHAGLPC